MLHLWGELQIMVGNWGRFDIVAIESTFDASRLRGGKPQKGTMGAAELAVLNQRIGIIQGWALSHQMRIVMVPVIPKQHKGSSGWKRDLWGNLPRGTQKTKDSKTIDRAQEMAKQEAPRGTADHIKTVHEACAFGIWMWANTRLGTPVEMGGLG